MIDIKYNYLIGKAEHLSETYNYKNRPDPDTDGCKKLYDDILELLFSNKSLKAENLEQQFLYNPKNEKKSNDSLWEAYFSLNNKNRKRKLKKYKPPFYTITYKDYMSSSDYIGPSIYWTEQAKADDITILDILNKCHTIGGHILWPRGEGKTVNQARGGEKTFYDRIDWTLFLVKIYYFYKCDYEKTLKYFEDNYSTDKERINIVLDAVENYKRWFEEFKEFNAFCDFFLLKESFVDANYEIIWFAPQQPIYPSDFVMFAKNNVNAVTKRNDIIANKYAG